GGGGGGGGGGGWGGGGRGGVWVCSRVRATEFADAPLVIACKRCLLGSWQRCRPGGASFLEAARPMASGSPVRPHGRHLTPSVLSLGDCLEQPQEVPAEHPPGVGPREATGEQRGRQGRELAVGGDGR